MPRFFLTLIIFTALQVQLFAQALPVTQVFCFNMEQLTDSLFEFSNPLYLTDFNQGGYNNQPCWINENELFLTVQFASDTSQTDIYSLNIEDRALTRVTATPDSEYSPLVMPVGFSMNKENSRQFSVVRVENDGKSTQRLWQFPIDRSNNGKPVFQNVTEIGYHQWINRQKVALFIVGENGAPHNLSIANPATEFANSITNNIGRCMQLLPTGDLAYVTKLDDQSWLLKRLNTTTYRSELITATLPQCEDFCILKDGTILMGKGSKLYKFNRAYDVSWLEIADFAYYGIRNISRLAVSPDGKLAIVERK